MGKKVYKLNDNQRRWLEKYLDMWDGIDKLNSRFTNNIGYSSCIASTNEVLYNGEYGDSFKDIVNKHIKPLLEENRDRLR